MKCLIIFTITIVTLAVIMCSNPSINSILDEMKDKPKKDLFKAFHFLHKKDYSLDTEEGIKRYKIFRENLKWVNAKNTELGQEVYGVTEFMDLTNSEFRERYLMSEELVSKNIQDMTKTKKQLTFLDKNLFDSYEEEDQDEKKIKKNLGQEGKVDWTSRMNLARNQGSCGSCWAFSAIATVEGGFNIKNNTLLDLSEQYLVDCDNLDNGCNGGWPTNTFEWLSKNGVVEEKDSPYTAQKGVCAVAALKPVELNIVSGFEMYRKGNDEEKKWYDLLSKGPVIVAVDASADGFAFYRPSNETAWEPKQCGQKNHAVTAVGFEKVGNEIILNIRNSWGQNWGINGYFKVKASNACGILDYAWLPTLRDSVPGPTPPGPNPPGPTPPGPTPPTPVPVDDQCVNFYTKCGFAGLSYKVCESVPELLTKYSPFAGVRFNSTSTDLNFYGFSNKLCQGSPIRITKSTECFTDSSNTRYTLKSVAFKRKPVQECITFLSQPCLSGFVTSEICGNIPYVQGGGTNTSPFAKSQSIVFDREAFDYIIFFDQENYLGKAYSISAKEDYIFNIEINRELKAIMKNTKSVLLGKKSIKVQSEDEKEIEL